MERIGEDGADEERLFRNLWDDETQREVVLESLKNRFQNVAYTNNRPQRTLGTKASTKHSIKHYEKPPFAPRRSPTRSRRHVACCHVACYLLLSSCPSAERSSVRAFERITSTASSRESPTMSLSHTKASIPSVAPIP